MVTFSDWLSFLVTSQWGRIWWANFQYDLAKNNIGPSVEADFRNEIERFISSLPAVTSPLEIIELVVQQEPHRFDLRSTRIPIELEPYSRVLGLTDFAFFNIKRSDLGLEWDEGTSGRVWDWLGGIISNLHYTGISRHFIRIKRIQIEFAFAYILERKPSCTLSPVPLEDIRTIRLGSFGYGRHFSCSWL